MTILLCHNRYRIRAGEDHVVDAEAAALRARGHRVVIYTRDNAEIEQLSILRRLAAVLAAFHNPRTARDIRRIVASEHPDVAHVHNVLPLISPGIYRVLQRCGIPVVQTIHNFRFVCINGLLFRDGHICHDCLEGRRWRCVCAGCYRHSRLQSLWYALILGWHRCRGTFTRCIDLLIALNGFTRDVLVRAGFDPARIMVKPNAATVDALDAPSPDTPAAHAVFVGRLSPEKGVLTLVRAALRVPNLPLRIVGDGPLADEIQDILRAADARHITLLGFLPPDAVARELAAALVTVFPSECYENCPMIVVNALYLGTPVVAARTGGIPDFVPDGRAGWLFTPGDETALAERLLWIAAHPGEVRALRPQVRAWGRDAFAPDKNCAALEAAYTTAIATGAARRTC
jgi:glycosyltransferase involved in cell wall biosynthesis